MTAWRCGYILGAAESGHVLVFGSVEDAKQEFNERINRLNGAAWDSWFASYLDGQETGKHGIYDKRPPPPSR